MLTITYAGKEENISEVGSDSSAFISCMTTLANSFIGLRPHVPEASERAQRVQLLMDRVYTSGVGVSREIVSLPAPKILRLYDVETGEPAIHKNGRAAKIILSLDTAFVTSTEYLCVRGGEFELIIRQFIDVPNKLEVSVVIELRQLNTEIGPRRLRLDYGLDISAGNEYLGTAPWLVARHYDINQCHSNKDGFSAIVTTTEQKLHYDVQLFSARYASTWSCLGQSCATSVTFDFSQDEHHPLFIHWKVRSKDSSVGLEISSESFNFISSQNEHQTRWNKLWEDHDVTINASDKPIELGIKYALFQLLQHGIGAYNRESGFISPARGLTSPYHSGATFFDTELHKCIFWVWNDPRVAKAFIDYRYYSMEKAIEFAKSTGFFGARFPEASNDHGAENGPHYVLSYPDADIVREWSVDEVLHISADVCYSLYRYWSVTYDDAYMNTRGYKIVAECARFAASVFKWSDKKQAYVINSVMGPDEYHYHVDNSFFTNYLLRWCIKFALSLIRYKCFPEISANEIKNWKTISENVYLPWMVVDGVSIPEEFDGYAILQDTELRNEKKRGPQFMDEHERYSAEKLQNFTSKIIKQADVVLLMSLFPDDFSDEVKRVTFNFYEPRTVHESSLSYGPHAVLAADIGKIDVCADFISRASRYNLDFTPILNYNNGLHLSAYAGAWQGLVEGLAGLRVAEKRLYFRPRLPSDWDSYRFMLYFCGQRLMVSVLADGIIDIYCGGKKLTTECCPDGRIYICGETNDFIR
ncbi:glycosyl hydrolase family 65 protein [Photorhabdus aegyptia]|uniref:glycosyl hydrolase family 65 protein n=1 Tax=Photorhabdus aegyptia TaxID=2805098 RepID=UPI001E4FA1FD|nr:glycosyl hydrolase family 65 protein [Photorhabdus aegyptia]MCC8457935.1 glycoside hydrolase family 65 protein [Photorhabdus aegyptia]